MNRKTFYDAIRSDPFKGSLGVNQVAGMTAILDEWDRRGLTDLRWLAYMLATTFHETARTMQPIAEYGRGKGRKYGVPAGPHGKVYYGRGFVQLTWLDNYKRAGDAVGVDLVRYPERAMETAIAAKIMFDGMIEGWFTTKKLADYFAGDKADWTNARRIINGTDKAALIAGYGQTFLAALERAAEAPAPKPVEPVKPDIKPVVKTPEPAGSGIGGWLAALAAAAAGAGIVLWRAFS